MPLLIDAHQDLASNSLIFNRDYRRSAHEIRQSEINTPIPDYNGHALVGWPEFQRGQVGLIIASLFTLPRKYKTNSLETQDYESLPEAHLRYLTQYNLYQRLSDENPDMFQLVRTYKELERLIKIWQKDPADYPQRTHPVGLILMMEGAEGLSGSAELEEWREHGLSIIAPVWAGTRYCGGTKEPGRFSKEGFEFLEAMSDLGYTLDIAHMSEESSLQALDVYPGSIIASHANARALLKTDPSDRHLTDHQLIRLFERDGVIGVMPFNRFLLPGWYESDPREQVTLSMLIDHIDHICQIAGNARHVAIGSDYDGGFGWPAVPLEIDTIADLQKISPLLFERGYSNDDVNAIFYGNWHRKLEQALPA